MHEVDEGFVPLAVKGREEEDEQPYRHPADNPAGGLLAHVSEKFLHLAVHGQEVERHEPAQHGEHDVHMEVLEVEGSPHAYVQHGVEPLEKEHERGRYDRGDEQRYDGPHGDVEHQHLQHEDEPRNGSLEDGRQGARGTASQQQRRITVIEPEDLRDIGADGRPRQYDGSLRPHRAAESDGHGSAHHRGITVVSPDARPRLADGVQHAGDTLRDIVLHDMLHEQRSEDDAHSRIDEKEITGRIGGYPAHEGVADEMQEPFERIGGETGHKTDDDGQDYHQLLSRQAPRYLHQQDVSPVKYLFRALHITP